MRVELGCEVASNIVEEINPDVVVIATGAQLLVPDIPGIKAAKVVAAWDILAGKLELAAQNVAILGGWQCWM